MQRARGRIHELTDRRRLLLDVDEIVQDVNRFLHGWAGYFRYGNSARQFDKINHYAQDRIARFVAKRHKRNWGYGLTVVLYQSPNRLGLINLEGTIVAPRPNRPWRPGRQCRRRRTSESRVREGAADKAATQLVRVQPC